MADKRDLAALVVLIVGLVVMTLAAIFGSREGPEPMFTIAGTFLMIAGYAIRLPSFLRGDAESPPLKAMVLWTALIMSVVLAAVFAFATWLYY